MALHMTLCNLLMRLVPLCDTGVVHGQNTLSMVWFKIRFMYVYLHKSYPFSAREGHIIENVGILFIWNAQDVDVVPHYLQYMFLQTTLRSTAMSDLFYFIYSPYTLFSVS